MQFIGKDYHLNIPPTIGIFYKVQICATRKVHRNGKFFEQKYKVQDEVD
jgi:hypothetical protein